MGRVVIPGFRKIETSGGEGGTTNYDDLTNKPSINNVPLVGNLSTVNLKLTDATLTEEGVPAEAKTVGQKLEEQSTSLTALSGQLGNHTVKSDVPENAVFTDTVYDDTEINTRISNNGYGEVAGGKNLFNPKCLLNATYDEKTHTINAINTILKALDMVFNENTQYTFSAYVKQGNSNPGIRLKVIYTDGTYNDMFLLSRSTSEVYVSEKSDSGKTISEVRWTYGSSGTATFRNFQIEEGSVATEYEPYFPSNKMLAEETSDISEDVDTLKKETTVNLLNPTLQTTTSNGITCTNNGDGTYTLNGTATDNCAFVLGTYTLPSGTYKLVGSSSSSIQTYYLDCRDDNNNQIIDVQDGNIFTTVGQSGKNCRIVIMNGAVCDNLVFKPMITANLDATYDDFIPYTGDTGKLNSDVAVIKKDINSIIPDYTSSITLTVTNSDIKEYVPSITFSREVLRKPNSDEKLKMINLSLTVGAGAGGVTGISGTLTDAELQKLQSMKVPSVFTNGSYVAFFGIGESRTSYTFNLRLYAPNPQGELTVFNNGSPVDVPITIKSLS